jgi:7-carboxy-7-deazaguanine synthase
VKGANPARGPVRDGGASLWVQEVFATLQGEGPFAGEQAVFVRLAGCNLKCLWCDTEFESSSWRPSMEELVERVESTRAADCDLVVLTGGEPLRQDVGPFIESLLGRGHRVQIETNGTLWVDLPEDERLTVVCSPKTTRLDPQLEARIDAYKYIIAAGEVDPEDGLPMASTQRLDRAQRLARPREGVPVWVQPRDDGDPLLNQAHLKAAVGTALEHGHRLGLQLHKIVGLD